MKTILLVLCLATFLSPTSWGEWRPFRRNARTSQPTPPQTNTWYQEIGSGLYAGKDGNMYLADSGRFIPLVLSAGGKVIPDSRFAALVQTPEDTVNQKAQAYYKNLRDTNESLWGRVAQKLESTNEGRAILSQYQKPAAPKPSGPDLVEAPQPNGSAGAGRGTPEEGGRANQQEGHDGPDKTATERPQDNSPKPNQLEMLERRFAKLKPLNLEELKPLMEDGKFLVEGKCTSTERTITTQFGLVENQVDDYGKLQTGISGGIIYSQPDFTAAKNKLANLGRVHRINGDGDLRVRAFDLVYSLRREENKLISCSGRGPNDPSCCEFDLSKKVATTENPEVKQESDKVAEHFKKAVRPTPKATLALMSRNVANAAPFRCHLEGDPTRVIQKAFDISRLSFEPIELSATPDEKDSFNGMKEEGSTIIGTKTERSGKTSYTHTFKVMGQEGTTPQNLLIEWEVDEKKSPKQSKTKWLCEGKFLPKTNPPVESMRNSNELFRVEGEVIKSDDQSVVVRTPDGSNITLDTSSDVPNRSVLTGYLPNNQPQPIDPKFVTGTKLRVGDTVNLGAHFYDKQGPFFSWGGHYLAKPTATRTKEYDAIRDKVQKALAELRSSAKEPKKFRELYSQFLRRDDLIAEDYEAATKLAEQFPPAERPYLDAQGSWLQKQLNEVGEKGDYLAMTQKEILDYFAKSVDTAEKESDFKHFDYKMGLLKEGDPGSREARKTLLKRLIDKAEAKILAANESEEDTSTFTFRYMGAQALQSYGEFAPDDFDYILQKVQTGVFYNVDYAFEEVLRSMSPAARMKQVAKIKAYLDSRRDDRGKLPDRLDSIEAALARDALAERLKE